MSLRERMGGADPESVRRARFRRWGVLENPFPSANQTTGHPRLEDAADERVADTFRSFSEGERQSQVLLVEGTQGTGKTNLLKYYEDQFRDYHRDDEGYYIIRYYPDPEPTLDSVIRQTFLGLDHDHFAKIGKELNAADTVRRNSVKEIARGHEVRLVLNSLQDGAVNGDLEDRSRLAVEWFTGMRVLRRHRDALGVSFRLDTKESRVQALRDIVYVSERLDLLRGVFLLMDELEKQDQSFSTTPVLRFLLAVRALIDALPRCLFLMLAMTAEARRRYFSMLPALAGRLENKVTLSPIQDPEEAVKLAKFYLDQARSVAIRDSLSRGGTTTVGTTDPLGADAVRTLYHSLREESENQGTQGVLQRKLLHRLREAWAARTGSWSAG